LLVQICLLQAAAVWNCPNYYYPFSLYDGDGNTDPTCLVFDGVNTVYLLGKVASLSQLAGTSITNSKAFNFMAFKESTSTILYNKVFSY